MKILHIPKTGGTTLKSSLIDGYKRHSSGEKYLKTKIPELYFCDHSQKLDDKDNYIIFIRDPIERFISHFVFLKRYAIGYDTENYFKNLNLDDNILNNYNTINDLAKDLNNIDFDNFKLITTISNYLIDIEKHKNNILFAGRTEYLKFDFILMQEKIGQKNYIPLNKNYTNIRPKKYDHLTKLDKKSLKIMREYLNKDYEIIKSLVNTGFLNKNYLNEINFKI